MWLLVLNAFMCSLNLSMKLPQFALYTSCCSPGMSICTRRNGCICQGSVVSALVVSGWCYLFAVRFSSLFLNKFVINVVSLPRYVEEAHFYLVVSVCPSEVVVECLSVGVDRETIV